MEVLNEEISKGNYVEAYNVIQNLYANRAAIISDFEDEESVILILDELSLTEEDGEHDGDPCTMNLDKTNYYGTCNKWQKVKVFFIALFSCSEPAPFSPSSEWINYGECIQDVICDNC